MAIKPIVCGDDVVIDVPDVECSDCEQVEAELQQFKEEMTQCCNEVKLELEYKQDILSAGSGIEIYDNIISATGGGGGVTEEEVRQIVADMMTPETIMAILGYSEIEVSMVDDDGNSGLWAFAGRVVQSI